MNLNPISPRKALNKAFLKVKPNRNEIEDFKKNLILLLDQINEAESEEFHKNLISDFLKNTYYSPGHFINTKSRNDLVIHNGKDAKTTVGVIVEAKKPTNKAEMISKDNINQKAMQELVLYYLRERISNNNLELKYLIATNIYEWFVFDAHFFEKQFAQNKTLVKQFADFEEGRMAGNSTDFFYKQIAAPAIAAVDAEFSFTYFDIRDYDKPLRNQEKEDDKALIPPYKLFAPQHLLKLPFANDSNSLDKVFYSELLHIIGLTEVKEGSKKLIERRKEGDRYSASLIENAILQLDSLDKISRIEKPGRFGQTMPERLFSVALELSITWINRILFLKLLEAQLVRYHKSDKMFTFLNTEKIKNFDDLNLLFFSVLARMVEDRPDSVKTLFKMVPYLNSSLFEPTELEHSCLFISQLKDGTLPVLNSTVLKDNTGKKCSGQMETLEYLFEFLNAYDFSSEGAEDVQEENKTLINASVLGLIFEKINGYKDGSFFTPGFITMYMCRETIRRAVVQKFNDAKQWNCEEFSELYDKIEDKKDANSIINSLKICDPAVGSGHFLVSALNEIIAIKSELKILLDRQGKTLRDYHVEVINDELIVSDEDARPFEYRPGSPESQRVQEALFHEKQTIIENCLFGVDINPNSVKICRLRLWIELLKNAYYKAGPGGQQLETLPNIDINIKCGNSLISRYALDADIKTALKRSKWTIDSYRIAVQTYRNAQSKDEKRAMEKLINTIKGDFETELTVNDKRKKKLTDLKEQLYLLTTEQLFGYETDQKRAWNNKVKKTTSLIHLLEIEIEEIKSNKIYDNAFEWRFEFPEVLNDEGVFIGFDVLIGNPPYIRQEELVSIKTYLERVYPSYAGTADLYVYFIDKGAELLVENGNFIFIIPNKWMRAGYGRALRGNLSRRKIISIIDFGDLPVFEEATTYPCVLSFQKSTPSESFNATVIDTLDFPSGLPSYLTDNSVEVKISGLQDGGWTLKNAQVQDLLAKIQNTGIPLGNYVNGKIFYGIKTGFNEAFVISKAIRDKLIEDDPKSEEILKPFLGGKDIKRYQEPSTENFLIFARRGINISKYPAIEAHLNQFRDRLEPKPKNWTGSDWLGRKPGAYKWYEIQDAVDYFEEFEHEKVMVPDISIQCEAIFDTSKSYCVNTAYVIPGLKRHDIGLLNSKLILFYYSNLTQTIRGGYLRFIKQYLEKIPIVDSISLDPIVVKIINAKTNSASADTSELEKEIDHLVYNLFGLTLEEINLVEDTFKK